MVKKKTSKKNNTRLAVYFGGLIVFIIIISIIFKGVDLFRSSKFDGKNRFTIVLVNPTKIDILSVSPREEKLSRLTLENTAYIERVRDYEVPYDAVVTAKKEITGNPQRQFANLLFHKRSVKGNLTIVDLLNLYLVSRRVSSENVVEERENFNDKERVEDLSALLFQDPRIVEEKLSITVTNTTQTPGLGNKVADYATNLGGSVVLVNTSRDKEKVSKIYYKEPNYTSIKLSKVLGIPLEQKDSNSISDIIISVGEDY